MYSMRYYYNIIRFSFFKYKFIFYFKISIPYVLAFFCNCSLVK